uniref:Uncharacterized protein n=1 Tax=Romanomermis culicivorax TaxID=13658 RepID=A0A915K7Y1_ROMCU
MQDKLGLNKGYPVTVLQKLGKVACRSQFLKAPKNVWAPLFFVCCGQNLLVKLVSFFNSDEEINKHLKSTNEITEEP